MKVHNTAAAAAVMSGVTNMNNARREAKAREVLSIDEWLADKESAFARIVPARPVNGETRRRRV